MPLLNIEIKRIRDRYSSFGNTSKKGDIDEDNRITDEAINALVDYVNSYDGQLYQTTKEHEGEYLYIGEDGKIATKIALMDDLPDFVITGDLIENGSLTSAHIQPGSLTGNHFEAGTFKDIPVGALQITKEHIGQKAINAEHIGEDITNEKIAEGAIGENNLQEKIILPEHISDEGVPLRCLPEFGTAYYLKYENVGSDTEGVEDQEVEKLIQHFVLNNPNEYSVVIENRGCYSFTVQAENKGRLNTLEFINMLPNHVLSIISIYQLAENREENDENTLVELTRDREYATQNGYSFYSLPRRLNTIEAQSIEGNNQEEDAELVCNYYYDDYFILPLSNPTFYSTEAKEDINEDGITDLFNLKVNNVQPKDEENIISNFTNSGFVKIYISKNANGDIIL